MAIGYAHSTSSTEKLLAYLKAITDHWFRDTAENALRNAKIKQDLEDRAKKSKGIAGGKDALQSKLIDSELNFAVHDLPLPPRESRKKEKIILPPTGDINLSNYGRTDGGISNIMPVTTRKRLADNGLTENDSVRAK